MEGKKKYFALIIFLFLGLMIFTFANPAEEEKEFKGGDSNQSETVTDKREDTTEEETNDEEQEPQQDANQAQQNVVTNNNQGNAQGGNQGNNAGQTEGPVDTTLRDALAAVEKAEGTYTQKDVDAAKDLVNNVTDTTEKGKLEERLEEVEAGIAVLALVEQLEGKVEDAAKKEDMTNAAAFRDTQEIANKINALNNKTVKEELSKRLGDASKLLDDNAAPTTKVEAKVYGDNVEITAEDEAGNPFQVFLTKDEENEEEISSGHKTASDGVYTLRLVDNAFNEQTIKFTVDTTAPALKDLTNGAHYEEITLNTEDATKVTIKVTNQDKNETKEVEEGTKLTEDATYEVLLTEEAGNTSTYWLAIDTTRPQIHGVNNNGLYNTEKQANVKDKFLALVKVSATYADGTTSEEEFTRADFIVGENNENYIFRYKATKDGIYTIYAEDKIGNSYSETFTIDRVAPKAKVVGVYSVATENHKYLKNGEKIRVVVEFDEEVKLSDTFVANFNGKKKAFIRSDNTSKYEYIAQTTLPMTETKMVEGKVSVTITGATDLAGNTAEPITELNHSKYNELTYDRTPATITVKTYGKNKVLEAPYHSTVDVKAIIEEANDYTATLTYTEDGKLVTKSYTSGTRLGKRANYTLTVVDAAGNTSTIEFAKDADKPKISGVEDGAYYNTTVTPKITDQRGNLASVTLNGNDYVSETPITEEGTYTIVAKDKAGNERKVTFTIDTTDPVVDYVALLSNETEDYKYIKNNEVVRVLVAFNEEIKVTDNFVLTINGTTKKFTRSGDKSKFEYIAQYKIPENESTMAEGPVQIAISGYQDLAGNAPTTVLTTANHYKYNSLTYDRTAPTAKNVEIKGITANPGYAKVGDEIWVGIIADEQMTTLPTITINGVVGEKVQEIVNEGGHLYYAKVNMTKEMASGEIKFTIDGYKDAAGNQGVKLTNKDINLGLDKIVLDKTKPELRIKPTSVGKDPYYSKIEFQLYDSNSADYYIINGTKKDFTNNNLSDANYQNLKAYLKTGKNKIELYDVAGNKTEKEFYYYEGYIFIETAQELKDLFADSAKLDNKKVMLIADIDMKGIQWKAASNVSFVFDGQNHTISNVTYESNESTGLFVNHLGAKKVTFKNVIIDNANIKSNKAEDGAAAIFVADADTADEINIKNCVVKNSTITNVDGWVGGFIGYTAGYNKQNNGPVYSDVTIEDSEIYNSTLTGAASSVGAAVGHSGGNPDTTTTIKNFTAKNNTLKGESKNKTGVVVGTAHVGKTIISNVTNENNTVYDEQNSKALYGRFLPNETGYLEIDGERIYLPINVSTIAEFKKALAEGYKEIIINKTLDVEEDLKLPATKQTKVTTVDKITMFNVKEGQSLTLENIILDGENKYKVDVTKAATMHNDPFNIFGEYPTEQTRVYAATPLINSNGTLTLGAGTVIRNYAHQPVSPQYGGPAVSITGGSVVINGLEFTNNVSQLLTAKNATVTINNINVHDTWATGNKAGLIEINTGATMDVNNGTFKNNMMSMRSAGLFIANGGTINMKGGHYENNASTRNGSNTSGSLFMVETTGKIYMTGGTIINNIGYRAGAFSSRWTQEGSVVELNGGTIKNNTTRNADFKNASIFARSYFKIGKDMIIEDKVVADTATAVIDNYGKIVGDVEVTNINGKFNNHGTVTGTITVPQP